MTLKERLHWVARMTLMVFILASVAFLSALTAMRYAVLGREVTIPELLGKHSSEAQKMLQTRGVGMTVEDRIYSPEPLDTVVRQSPTPNMRVKIGQNAHVVLSLGAQSETIPVLDEKTLRAARIELMRSGMQVGEISSAYLPLQEQDAVIRQDPAPGTTDITSPHVNMLISLGPRPPAYVMPDLMGLTLLEAESKLSSPGLKVAKLINTSVPGAPHNTVVGQTPSRGQRIDTSVAIQLQVAE